MKIIGIDPGYGRVGWAILEGDVSKLKLVDCGCLETSSSDPLAKRLSSIYIHISELVKKYKPDEAAVEELYFFKNAKTVMGVGQARGVILLGFSRKNIPVFDYTPLEIKSAVAGYGRADKSQVQKMIKRLLNLDKIPSPDDVADACAVALTHIFSNKKLT